MDIEELIHNVISAAQNVTSCFEYGSGTAGAAKELEEERQVLITEFSRLTARVTELEALIASLTDERVGDSRLPRMESK